MKFEIVLNKFDDNWWIGLGINYSKTDYCFYYATFEQAEEAGILKAIEILKERNNGNKTT